jgi:hypothetical protein
MPDAIMGGTMREGEYARLRWGRGGTAVAVEKKRIRHCEAEGVAMGAGGEEDPPPLAMERGPSPPSGAMTIAHSVGEDEASCG